MTSKQSHKGLTSDSFDESRTVIARIVGTILARKWVAHNSQICQNDIGFAIRFVG